jgi:Ca-activated chloride channel family protein
LIRIFLAAFILIGLLVLAQAQEPPTFSVSVNLVKVPFSVFNSGGGLVNDLRREDFQLWEDGIPQQIRSFGIDVNPISIVLLLDSSATAKGELKKIKEAAEDFAQALSSEDRFSILTFDDEVKKILDWTSNPKDVRKALGKIEPGLRTALYDAMYLGADQFQNVEGRKAIVLLTDCLNNQSSLGFHDAERAVVESQASLYVVSKTIMVRQAARTDRRVIMLTDIYKRLFGNDDYIDEFFSRRESEMAGLAEKTGGRCFFPSDYDQIRGQYKEIAAELKSKYFLTYVSNQTKSPNSFHNIALDYLPGASKMTYRKGYFYEPPPIYKRLYPRF